MRLLFIMVCMPAVRALGKKNTRNREAGMPRIIPAKYIPSRAPNVLWKKYRAELIMKGIRAQKFDPNPSYCKYGDSSEVS